MTNESRYSTQGRHYDSFKLSCEEELNETTSSNPHISNLTAREQEHYKTYYVDRHAIYINNNGYNESFISDLLRNALSAAPHRESLPANHVLWTFVYVKRKESGIKGERGYLTAEDKSVVYLYDSRDYDYLMGLDSNGFPVVSYDKVKNHKGLSDESLEALHKEIHGGCLDDWGADAVEDDEIYWKYYRAAFPLHVVGITQIPNELRKDWKKLLDKPTDIGILRCSATECRSNLIENRLTVTGVPSSWNDQAIYSYFKKFSNSTDPRYPYYTITPGKEANTRTVTITFDPIHKEAMFAQQVLRDQYVMCTTSNKMYGLRCKYAFTKGKGGVINLAKDFQSQAKAKEKKEKPVKVVDDDGFAVVGKKRRY